MNVFSYLYIVMGQRPEAINKFVLYCIAIFMKKTEKFSIFFVEIFEIYWKLNEF